MSTKVAFDTGPLVGTRSGIGRAVEQLIAGLRALPAPPELLPYVVSFRAALNPGTVRLPLPAALAQRIWARTSVPPMDRLLRRPQVVHGTNYVVPPARAARLVSVYDCWFLRHPLDVHPDVARAGAVLRRAVSSGAIVHASSHATAEAVRELLGAPRVEVIHLGALPLAPPPATVPKELARLGGAPFVVAIGTMERRKNLPILIRAFGELAAIEPGLALVLAGGPANDSEAIRQTVGRLPGAVRSRIHVLGIIDEATKSWLVHHARVLAYPSLDEGFGFPVLEAFAAGTPVAASTAGSIPEIAGSAAALVDPPDVEQLAATLHRLHTDDVARSELISAGTRRLADFDWATTARRMASLYDALAMEGAPR